MQEEEKSTVKTARRLNRQPQSNPGEGQGTDVHKSHGDEQMRKTSPRDLDVYSGIFLTHLFYYCDKLEISFFIF